MRACLGLLLACGVAAAEKPPVRVAVMDFTAASTAPEFAPLGAGLQSMITTDLGELPAFVLVERARLRDIQSELKLAESGAVDKQTAAKIGSLSGASHLLVGSFTVVGGRMRIDARLFAVQSGDVVLTEKMEGAQTAFFELEKQLVGKIVQSVGVKLNKAQKSELQKPQTTNFEAFEKYSQGLVLADEKKGPEAIAAMQAAVDKDPAFALAGAKLKELQALFPPSTPKPPEAQQCQQNPMLSGGCQPSQNGPPIALQPTMFGGGDNRHFDIDVKSQAGEIRCVTPCQLHLPPGALDIDVLSPVKYHQQLNIPGGPSSITVSGKNRTNLIAGSVLAAGVGAMLVTSIILYTVPYDTGSSANYFEYGPIPLALATGMIFPAVYYLLHIGKNEVKVGSF
jgi:TolB-like protein